LITEAHIEDETVALIIADDHERERAWLKDLLARSFSSLLPIFEAANGRQAVELVKAHKPALAFLDIEMPVLSGIKAAQQILELSPGTGIVIISHHSNEIWVRQLWKIMPAEGAFAYVLKDSTDRQIIEAVQAVLNGDCWVHPRIQRVLLKARESDHTTLTDGEFEVLAYICLGLTDRAISRRLYLTEKAIQARLKAVYSKLGLKLRGTAEDDEFNHRCRAINTALRNKLINTAQLEEWESSLRIDAL
jgi:DNA-binding NarL/FixJ family response regulator